MRVAGVFRWVGAVLFGVLVPALIYTAYDFDIDTLPLAYTVALLHAVLLGLPAAVVFNARNWTTLATAVGAGFLIGAAPGSVLTLPLGLTSETIDGVPLVFDGVVTAAGWLQYLEVLAVLGGLGATGGATAWVVFRLCGKHSTHTGRPRWIAGASIAGAAVAASIGVAAVPSITMDRTCHNEFRHGQRSVRPELSIDLDITPDGWPELTALFNKFADAHRMSLRDSGRTTPGIVKVLRLSACVEDGVQVEAMEQRWASRNYAPFLAGEGLMMGVYDPDGSGQWQTIGRDFVAALRTQWPAKVRFRAGDSKFISEREAFATPLSPIGHR
jgi:hypothetical protein